MKEEQFKNFMENDDEEGCPFVDVLASLTLMPKPFGIIWDDDKIENFLEKRGYKIIERFSEFTGESYKVAVKKDDSYIPEDDCSNLSKVFSSEVQDILSNWLLKLGTE